MSDYYPLLSRMVAGLPTNNGESRRALYARARVALCDQLRGREPPFTNSEITRERLSLEAAIRKFEADAIRKPHELLSPDPAAVPTDFGPAAAVRVSAAPVERSQAPPPVSPAWRPNGVAPREQLVEPAAVAQLVGAREGVGSTPRGNGREGEGRNSDTRAHARTAPRCCNLARRRNRHRRRVLTRSLRRDRSMTRLRASAEGYCRMLNAAPIG
jgi:hypothetical protein